MSSPLGLIEASLRWNTGLLNASAINSLRFSAPYAVSKYGLTSLYNFSNCLVAGWDLFFNWLIVAACVVSCSKACMVRGMLELSITVLILGSNKPATSPLSPISYPLSFRLASLANFILVVPVFSDNALAICLTRLLLVLFARDCNAPFKSPFFSSALTSLGRASLSSSATLGSSSKLSTSILPPPATNLAVSTAIFARNWSGDISSVRGSFVLALPCTFSTASLTISSFLAALSARAVGLGSVFGVALDGVDVPTTLALPAVALSTSCAILVSRCFTLVSSRS